LFPEVQTFDAAEPSLFPPPEVACDVAYKVACKITPAIT